MSAQSSVLAVARESCLELDGMRVDLQLGAFLGIHHCSYGNAEVGGRSPEI